MTSLHGVYVTSSHHKFTPFLNVHSMIHILKVSKQHHILKQIWRVFFLHIIFFLNQETLCQIRYNIMGLFMFLNLGIKMPEIRLVIRCICAPLLHVSVCLHFGNNLSFYRLHFFIVFVFVQKSVKQWCKCTI